MKLAAAFFRKDGIVSHMSAQRHAAGREKHFTDWFKSEAPPLEMQAVLRLALAGGHSGGQ